MKHQDRNSLIIQAYDQTAKKYHQHFKNELRHHDYDKAILDKFSKSILKNGLICDIGCGPSAQIGEYLLAKNHTIIGIDISPKCIEIAKQHIPEIEFKIMDMMHTEFDDQLFDGLVSFYSIIFTPKRELSKILLEFHRILKKTGKLLLVVKKGNQDGLLDDEWYEGNQVYFAKYMEKELEQNLNENGFLVEFTDTRKPCDNEVQVDRIYIIASKKQGEITSEV